MVLWLVRFLNENYLPTTGGFYRWLLDTSLSFKDQSTP